MIKKFKIRDYIQFRLVLLDDYDNVTEVLYESPIYNTAGDKFVFDEEQYDVLLKFNRIYNFADYDNVPPMEFQARRKSTGDKWWYLSDPIEDYMNL